MLTKNNPELFPMLGCLIASTLWGVLWYPLRILEQWGVAGLWATLIIYISAFIPVCPLVYQQLGKVSRQPLILIIMGLSAGWTNLAFILAVIEGPVVRVLLLFYLSPIWTVILGWIFLKERLSLFAWLTVVIALAGALIMHWHPESGLHLMDNNTDLLAISSGFAFAVTNVCVRKTASIPIILKMGSAWTGVIILSLLCILVVNEPWPVFTINSMFLGISVGSLGMIIMTFCAQYGVTHLPLHRSAVIFLFEVVAGAVSAALLTNEVISLQEWTGGALVMLAAWLTAMDSLWGEKPIISISNKC